MSAHTYRLPDDPEAREWATRALDLQEQNDELLAALRALVRIGESGQHPVIQAARALLARVNGGAL